jgi:chromate transporter
MNDNVLADLFLLSARLSLIAIGGLNTIIPELQRQVVDVHGWMTAAQLADLIALAQASPGPNGLVLALIGWQVAGLNGFLVATVAGNVPPAVLAFCLFRVRRKLDRSRLLRAAQDGLVPVVVGLILASGFSIARATDDTLIEVAMTVVVALLVWRTRLNPLWMLSVAALIGLTGFYLG